MGVQTPSLGEVISRPQAHRFHQIDAHTGGGVVFTRRNDSKWIAFAMEGLDQHLKTHGLNAVIVGQEQPMLPSRHEVPSSRVFLIVRFPLCNPFARNDDRHQARNQHNTAEPCEAARNAGVKKQPPNDASKDRFKRH